MSSGVFRLREPGEVDPSSVLTGPLRAIRRVRLAAGEESPFAATDCEFTLFVLAGTGTVLAGSAEVPLHYGVSVTAPLNTVLRVVAGTQGLEYFLAELKVGGRGQE
jgi:mannose-6-phosphate isomerase-like protein (cupin superfamily)